MPVAFHNNPSSLLLFHKFYVDKVKANLGHVGCVGQVRLGHQSDRLVGGEGVIARQQHVPRENGQQI